MYKINALDTPTERNQNSLHNAIHNTGSQTESEAEWINDRDDLVAVARDQERSLLNALVEDGSKAISRPLTRKLFRTEIQKIRTGKENINLLSQDRLNVVTNVLITVIAAVLLLIPVSILNEVAASTRGFVPLGIILTFVLLFALCHATLTKAKKQEIFAATAAYAAVLVVFLSNNQETAANNWA